MRYCLSLLLLALLHATISSAQTFTWAKSMGGTFGDRARAVAVDGAGNVYTIGDFFSTADFDPSTSVYNLTTPATTIYISKLNATGGFVWAKQLETGTFGLSQGFSIVAHQDGNLYISGYYNGTVDFDPGASVANMTSAGQGDAFILKLDTAGNYKWAKSMGGVGMDVATSVKVDGAGNIYTSGYFNNVCDFDPDTGKLNITPAGAYDAFVVKLDTAGKLLWANSVGGTSTDQALNMVIDATGNSYTCGSYVGTADFDPGAGVMNLVGGGTFILKLDNAGNLTWAKRFSGSGNIRSLAVSAANLYATGDFSATTNFDPGGTPLPLISAGGTDVFVSRLDTAGIFQWLSQIGGKDNEQGMALATDDTGNVYTTGFFKDTADFDPGASTVTMISNGGEDVFMSKLDAFGQYVWSHQVGGTSNDRGLGIVVTQLYFYIAGSYQNTADFNPGAAIDTLKSAGAEDAFVLTMAQCIQAPATPGPVTGPVNGCSATALTYSVQPVPGANSYTWTTPAGWMSNNSNTNAINVMTGLNSGVITVVAVNACGVSGVQSTSVAITTAPVPVITITGQSLGVPAIYTSYQWYLNTQPISGATTDNYMPVQTGYYTVVVVDGNGCSRQSNSFYFMALSVNNISLENAKIYPNPGNGIYTIETVVNSKEAYTIADLSGKIIKDGRLTGNKTTIDISSFSNGVYMLRVGDGVRKLVKL